MLSQARTVRASPPCAKIVNTPKGVRTQGSVDRRVDASCHGVLLLTTFCMQRLQEINEFTMYLRWPRNLPHEARCNPGRAKRHWCSLTHSSSHCGEGGVNTKTSFRTSEEVRRRYFTRPGLHRTTRLRSMCTRPTHLQSHSFQSTFWWRQKPRSSATVGTCVLL